MELIKNSPKDCYPVVQKTTLIVLKKLESLLNIEDTLVTASDRAQLRDLQSQLCATLQSVLHKVCTDVGELLQQVCFRCIAKTLRWYRTPLWADFCRL